MHATKKRSRRRLGTGAAFEHLRHGVLADETLARWHARARWSFFRNITPAYTSGHGADAHALAVLRCDEWFLFDLILPGAHMPTADRWLRQRAGAHGWSAREEERYRGFLGSFCGLFKVVERLGEQSQRLVEAGGGMPLVAVDPRVAVSWPEDTWLVARLFPRLDTTWEISPATTPVSGAVAQQMEEEGLSERFDALEAERLLGASLDWVADSAGTALLERAADEFLASLTRDSVGAAFITSELAGLPDPAPIVARLLLDLHPPLTPVEPQLTTELIVALWAHDRARTEPSSAAAGWRTRARDLSARLLSQSRRGLVRPALADALDAPGISEHEIARLRNLPLQSGAEWVGDHLTPSEYEADALETAALPAGRLEKAAAGATPGATLPIGSTETQAAAPEAGVARCQALWVDRRDGRLVAAEALPPDAPAEAVLRALLHAMTSPAFGPPRRPGRVLYRRAAVAAALKPALRSIDVDVDVVYVAGELVDMSHGR